MLERGVRRSALQVRDAARHLLSAQLGPVCAARHEHARPVAHRHLPRLGERATGDLLGRLVEVDERLVRVGDVDRHRKVRGELAREYQDETFLPPMACRIFLSSGLGFGFVGPHSDHGALRRSHLLVPEDPHGPEQLFLASYQRERGHRRCVPNLVWPCEVHGSVSRPPFGERNSDRELLEWNRRPVGVFGQEARRPLGCGQLARLGEASPRRQPRPTRCRRRSSPSGRVPRWASRGSMRTHGRG